MSPARAIRPDCEKRAFRGDIRIFGWSATRASSTAHCWDWSARCAAPDGSSCELTTWPGRCVMQVYPPSGDFTRRWRRSASICCCVAHKRSLSARQGRFVACECPRAGDWGSMIGECCSFRHSTHSTGARLRPWPKSETVSWERWPRRSSFCTPAREDRSMHFAESWLPAAASSGLSTCPRTLPPFRLGPGQPPLRNLHTTGGLETVDLDRRQCQADSQRQTRTITIVTIHVFSIII